MWVLAGENLIYIDRITLYYNSCRDCDRGYFCGGIWHAVMFFVRHDWSIWNYGMHRMREYAMIVVFWK